MRLVCPSVFPSVYLSVCSMRAPKSKKRIKTKTYERSREKFLKILYTRGQKYCDLHIGSIGSRSTLS